LITSHLQRLNSGKPLGIGCYEWLWSIGTVIKWDASTQAYIRDPRSKSLAYVLV